MDPSPDGQSTYPRAIHLILERYRTLFFIPGSSEEKTGLQPGGYHPEVVSDCKPAHWQLTAVK